MARYLVTWTIDVEDAGSPEEAARQARLYQAPGTSAVVFDVTRPAHRPPYVIHVEIPREASDEDVDRVFDAVTQAAESAAGDDRDWDLFIYGTRPRPREESR